VDSEQPVRRYTAVYRHQQAELPVTDLQVFPRTMPRTLLPNFDKKPDSQVFGNNNALIMSVTTPLGSALCLGSIWLLSIIWSDFLMSIQDF